MINQSKFKQVVENETEEYLNSSGCVCVQSCDYCGDDYALELLTPITKNSPFWEFLIKDIGQTDEQSRPIEPTISETLELTDEVSIEEAKSFLESLRTQIECNKKAIESLNVANKAIFERVQKYDLLLTKESECLSQTQESNSVLKPSDVPDNNDSSSGYQQKQRSGIFCGEKSQWTTDDAIASEVIQEMEQTLKLLEPTHSENTLKNSSLNSNLENDRTLPIALSSVLNENGFEFTIEETTHIFMNLALRIKQLPVILGKQDTFLHFHRKENEEMLVLIQTLDNIWTESLFESSVELNVGVQDSYEFTLLTKRLSEIFLFLYKTLKSTPSELKNQPLATLNPPKSLRKTLTLLAPVEHFRDCFESVLANERHTNYIDVLEQMSSREIHSIIPLVESSSLFKVRNDLKMNNQDFRITDENGFGNTLSGIREISQLTLQDVSEMFLSFSGVLNDIPGVVKSKKLSVLNPPHILLKTIDFFCSSAENSMPGMSKRISVSSMTLQNASDVFFDLSRMLERAPPGVKSSNIIDLDPPETLLKAIELLQTVSNSQLMKGDQKQASCEIKSTEPSQDDCRHP